ncbi:hypothetical protein AXF42_Ash009184 [Apostasia shenzhenica]|uniref:DUF3741 domain-containing protein n=1 Tax=Apostasia shenzhenica TaxID=1088818 RepID=A0A2I0ADQ7_9ASPA|nr:hypothetical protein AXF42_Ash009184 [Apostasia shenzhenica]
MSKNFSDAFSHQNPECKKSAGCLSGIFQLFDNQIIRRRRLDGQGHKMGFSGHEPSSPENQRTNKSELCNLKKRLSKMPQENPRFSLESPRTSTLSSSSFSSHEHKSSQEGPTNPDRSFTSGKSPKNSARAQSSDINHQSPELIDIIKESLYKDFRSVSVKEGANVLVKKNKVLKPIDSPRPMDMSKLKVLNETLRIPTCSSYKDYSARFSCDGREVLQIFTDAEQSSKEREPPRLSLGSYEESLRRDLNFKVNSIFKGLEKKSKETSTASNFLEDQESNENHPTIVAKLMGLEPINLAKHNVIRSCGFSNFRRNMKTAQESKRENPSQSKGHSLIFPRSGELNLESTFNMRFPTENISAYIAKEMRLQKLQQEHSSELKESILEIKKDCNWKQNTENSISPQPRESKLKTKTESISESALKSAKLGLPPTPVARLEIRSHVQKKQTRNSADRINGIMIVRTDEDQRPTGNKSNSRRPQHASKLPSERLENKCRSQRLELRKSDLNKKPYVVISSTESNNFKKQPKDMQSSKSVSLKLNLSNTQDNEHQNPSKQFDVDSLTLNSSKVKALLLKQSNQKSGKAINNAAAEHKKHTMKLKEDQSVRHFEQDTALQSSPNSVLDALLHYEDLPLSPVSFSSGFKAEDQKLPSDHSLNMVRHPLNPPMTLSFEIDSEEMVSMENIN